MRSLETTWRGANDSLWRRVAVFTALLVVVLPAAQGQTVSDLSPRTVAPGVANTLTVTGSDLAGGLRAAVSDGLVTVDEVTAERAVLTVTPSPDAAGGLGLWLFTAAGAVEPIPLMVDALPVVSDAGDNQNASTPQPLAVPCSVDGVASGPTADWFRFHALAGQRLAFEVLTQSLGSAMDPVLILRDSLGRQLAMADDDAVGPECHVEHVFENEGDYTLELQDSRHKAGGRYHLRVGDFPLDLACHPLALQRGVPATFGFTSADPAGSTLAPAERTVAAGDTRSHVWLTAGNAATAWTRVLVSDLPQHREEEASGVLMPPVGLSGRLSEPGETDTYTLAATAGQAIRIRAHSRSLGLPTLAQLRLLAADGTTIAATSPSESDEWTLEATPPADGEVRLEVSDLLGRGGHRFGYQLEITPATGFDVALAGDAKTRQAFPLEPASGAAAIPLTITRRGYAGAIELALEPAVPGLNLIGPAIPADAKEHRVFLHASDPWQADAHAVVRLTARAAASDGPRAVVGSLSLARAREPRVPFPEAWSEGALAAAGVRPSEPVFSLGPSGETVFARPVQSHTATLALTRVNEAFKEAVTLLASPRELGWSVAAKAENDTYTATLTRTDAASEPAQLTLLAYAEHGGRGSLTPVDLPVRWVDPLEVSLGPTSPLVAGRSVELQLAVRRDGGDPQPVTFTVTGLPEGWPVPEPLSIAADASGPVALPLTVPATATGDTLSLSFSAASTFQGQAYTITGTLPLPSLIPAPTRIEVFPERIDLAHRSDSRQLVVTGYDADGNVRDWTHDVSIEAGSPGVIDVHEARVTPLGDGETELVVRVGDVRHTLPVRVTGSGSDRPVAFESEVLVALSKQGCSSGACHGSPSGKGMFRLSLRGFDAALDALTLIREDFGRRVNTFEPDASLLLAKPLMQVSHGGGKQLHASDAAHAVLRRWIAEGAQADPEGTPRCVGIRLSPAEPRVLALAGGSQQLAVIADFADGTSRDVTPLAAYESSHTAIASVDADGRVTAAARGETVILARFLEHIESVRLTFLDPDPAFAWEAPTPHNFIDERVDEKLRLLEYTPSPLCSDDEFCRRVHLDVIGLLPTVDETRAFLADTSPTKREALIDRLLAREEYASYQALKWGDILRMTAKVVGDDGVYKYHRWVEEAFRSNMTYDAFAREILAAEGSTLGNPPANFYRAAATETDCVETVSQVFLGARLQCAKCHNHPFEKWTQDNYYGLAAFFEPVKRRSTQRPGEMFIYTAAGGGVTQPRTGEKIQPWLPGEGSLELADGEDARERLVDWLVSPANPFFARIEANRIWSSCFARGIVDPIDDFRDSNPPANGPLLDDLTRYFVESGFDRKALLRAILTSRTYQASVTTTASNADDTRYFSHQTPRLLAAEQLLDAIGQVTEVPELFQGLPADTKATQLPAPDLANNAFLEIFGQPQRSTVCACERTGDSNLGMAIAMFNGELIHAKLAAESNRFRRGLAAGRGVEELVDEIYLAALCRHPDDAELAAATAHVATRESPADGLEDLCWALLNTDEFLFQH